MPSNHPSSLLPVLSLLLAATLWGISWYPIRWLEENGLPGLWASLVMYGAVMVISLPWLWRRRSDLVRHPWLLLALALSAGWCNVSFIMAMIEGNVVRVLLLFYLSPLWAVLLGRVFLKERLPSSAWITFALAMSGALIMLWQPVGEAAQVSEIFALERADWLALSSGFMFALSNVLVRKIQDIDLPAKIIVVWWGGALLAGVWILLSAAPVPEFQPQIFAAAVLFGWFGIVIMTLTVQYGVTHMPVHRSAVILLFELIAGAVSAQLLSDETMLPREWLGGLLVMAAAYFSARQSKDSM